MGNIHRLLLAVVAVLVLSGARTEAASYTTLSCNQEKNFQSVVWPILTNNEPMLAEIWRRMQNLSGTYVLTNCVVQWPVQGTVAVEGLRTVVLDQQWYSASGTQRHTGMKLQYYLRSINNGDGSITIQRTLWGVQHCRTPKLCREMGVPFTGDVTTIPGPPTTSIPESIITSS